MGFHPLKITILVTALLGAGTPAHASLNQADAMAAAAAINRRGSDQSLQNSTTSAMKAMLELNAQNQPGALKNGYKAFGEYRTSEDLDTVRMKNRIRQIDLFTSNATVTTSVPEWAKKKEDFRTSYGRLDPKFLHEGEAGKVAEEFERKSGMKREVFLSKIAKASEHDLSPDDPRLAEKVMSRFVSFVDDIPNDEFRENVKKQVDSVSGVSRASLITDGAKRVFEVLAAYKVTLSPVTVATGETAAESARLPSAAAMAAASPAPVVAIARSGRAEDPLSATKKSFFQEMAPRDADLRGLQQEGFAGDPLGSVMQAALDEQGESSIFRQVSRRYRAIAPRLTLLKEQ